ncbi:MAG: hypothetical protein CMJ59_07320 [Planctomycetaceae bacterium]|nr:hypothetical protein [Planctomycetaceae bacterium]
MVSLAAVSQLFLRPEQASAKKHLKQRLSQAIDDEATTIRNASDDELTAKLLLELHGHKHKQ